MKWKLEEHPYYAGNSHFRTAFVCVEDSTPKDPEYICDLRIYKDTEEHDLRNAKLIAAAPELLFQVQQAMTILEVIDPRNPAIEQMESILKKINE